MTAVRLEPAAPRSRVKHSTTEPMAGSLGSGNVLNYKYYTFKPVLRGHLKRRPKVGLSFNAGQKYCRMLRECKGIFSSILQSAVVFKSNFFKNFFLENHHSSKQLLYRSGPTFYLVQSGYSETCLRRPLKNRQNKGLKTIWYLNAGQKYCRMLHGSILQYF